MGEQQKMIFEPENVDFPRREILASCPSPLVVFNLRLMNNVICAGVNKLYEVDLFNITRDFNKGTIDEIKSTTIGHVHVRFLFKYRR